MRRSTYIYISERLLDPAPRAAEAIDRLRSTGEPQNDALADELLTALKEFKSITRTLYQKLDNIR